MTIPRTGEVDRTAAFGYFCCSSIGATMRDYFNKYPRWAWTMVGTLGGIVVGVLLTASFGIAAGGDAIGVFGWAISAMAGTYIGFRAGEHHATARHSSTTAMLVAKRRNRSGELVDCPVDDALFLQKSIFTCGECGKFVRLYRGPARPHFEHMAISPACSYARSPYRSRQSARFIHPA